MQYLPISAQQKKPILKNQQHPCEFDGPCLGGRFVRNSKKSLSEIGQRRKVGIRKNTPHFIKNARDQNSRLAH